MKKIISIILALTAVMSGCTTLAEEKIKSYVRRSSNGF